VSNLETAPAETACGAEPVGEPHLLDPVDVALGGPRGIRVSRTLPHRQRRMVGAWCFLDAYGPHDVTGAGGMRVGPHPHTGLQTVSWLVAGQILHRDSLGSRRRIEPGQLNLMTAGAGISHSEETPPDASAVLQGVQLWVALPAGSRTTAPAFAHHADLPVHTDRGLTTTVIMGSLDGATSPAACHTPLLGAQVRLAAGGAGTVGLRADFEYAVLVLDGTATVDGHPLAGGPLLYLGAGRSTLRLAADGPACVLLLGGEPFDERIVMWWNFVGRDHDEIVAAREAWQAGTRFGTVRGYDGNRLAAPPMPTTRLLPRGRVR
jgi:redox-sensitive bicupin YhaK (pirin superfamily)